MLPRIEAFNVVPSETLKFLLTQATKEAIQEK
jgi:hypothetical protein